MLRVLSIRRIAVLALATGLALGVAGAPIATAAPTLAQEEQQGEGIAESLRSGERQCSDLSADDFELIGEYAMGSYLGDEGAHAAMNRRMTLMMGEAGERRMHVALGYRYSGCPGGPASGWVGAMGGMMGGRGPGGYGPGMMGGSGAEYGSGMTGGYRSGPGAGDNDFDGPSAAAMIGMMAVLIGAVAVVLLLLARRRTSGPLETLKRRYASGELSDEQYQESKRLLEGGR
jgi:hypothetical protein